MKVMKFTKNSTGTETWIQVGTPGPSSQTVQLRGDINGDTAVNVFDALLTLQYAVGLIEHNSDSDAKYKLFADVAPLDSVGKPNGDGSVNVFDALAILRHAVGLDGW